MNKLIIISILMIIVALFPMPYGYYQILHLVITVMSILSIYNNYKKAHKASFWVLLFGMILLVYNPLLKVHFEREIWQVINLITAVILAICLYKEKSNE